MIRRLAAGLAIAVAAAAALVAIAAVTIAMWPLPSRRGTCVIPELSAPVEVAFDAEGIPHIRAVLEDDAWRALGWVHASDRLFQMEMRRRAAAGRLAEVLGPALVPMDRDARTYGYRSRAQEDWDRATERERRALTAYADGVNAYLASGARPLELSALSIVLEKWTPLDSLAFVRLMEDGLTEAPGIERDAFDDARVRGVPAAIALRDASDEGTTRIAAETEAIVAARSADAIITRAFHERASAGSNAWAIAGSRTASGKPLLAGDPHLNAERPGVWYAAHLTSADGLDVEGLTLAAGPGVIIGHNAQVAWSVTMNQADDADYFLERIDDASGGTFLHGGSWEPLERRSETIHVRGGADVTLEVLRTVHGPVVERFDHLPGTNLARATVADRGTQGVGAFLEADRARSGAELLSAWSRYQGPPVNIVWAEALGGIGVKIAGAVPVRKAGDGRFPVPGWTGDYDWVGTIPFDALPSIENPPEGFVASANDDWSVSGRRLLYPGHFASAERAARAREMASALRRATVRDMRAMQTDVRSLYASRMVASLPARPPSRDAARAVAILRSWDARAEARGPARLYFALMKEIRNAIAPAVERAGAPAHISWTMIAALVAGRGDQRFWDDPATARVESRVDRLDAALAAALETVERRDGRNPDAWSWGSVHRLTYRHPFADALPRPLARRLSFGPVALPGEWHTLSVAGFSLRGDGYDVFHIPSARLIVDLADLDAARLVLPLGQSGQAFDRHGHDQLRAWAQGRDFPLPFGRAAVAAATVSKLRFVPSE